jgi:hypothetical protein
MRALTVMPALTDVLPGPDGPLPLLILDQRPDLVRRADRRDRPVARLR